MSIIAKAISKRKRSAGSLARRVRQITDELLTVNYGHSSSEMGDRLAIKKADGVLERDLGGRNRRSIEEVIKRHLANGDVSDRQHERKQT